MSVDSGFQARADSGGVHSGAGSPPGVKRWAKPPAPWLMSLLVFTLPFCVYLRTMAPTVYGLDSAELTAGAHVLGIVHSPGSPLFLMVAKLFTLIPLGDIGWRANLLSGVSSALAAVFVQATVRRLTRSEWVSLAAAWILAFSYYFWVWAVVAELYAVHACFAAALLYLLVRWVQTGRRGTLWLLGLVFGIGMGNHTALVLLVPAVAWVVLLDERRAWRDVPLLGGTALAAVAGCAAVYAYLPLRHAADVPIDYVRDYFPHVDLTTWPGMLWMVRGGMFSSLFFDTTWPDFLAHARRFLLQLVSNFGVLVTGIALVGIVLKLRGTRRERTLMIGLLLMFGCHALFFMTYGALDREWMYSVSYLVWAVCFGLGVSSIAGWAHRTGTPGSSAILQVLSVLIVLRLLWFNYPRYVDLHDDYSARRLGERILYSLEPEAAFIGMWEHVPILEYLQIVEGMRKDVTIRNAVFMGRDKAREAAYRQHEAGRAVYTTVTNFLAEGDMNFEAAGGGSCWRIRFRAPAAAGAEP